MSTLQNNIASLEALITKANALPEAIDITTPLAELNAVNGGTAATTIDAAVDNTEAHASSQEALIAQIAEALEGKVGGGSGGVANDPTCTVTFDNLSMSSDCSILFVTATVNINGVRQTYTHFYAKGEVSYMIEIPNIVCGTTINLGSHFYSGVNKDPYLEIDGSATFDSWNWNPELSTNFMLLTFTAPAVANESCTIRYSYNP